MISKFRFNFRYFSATKRNRKAGNDDVIIIESENMTKFYGIVLWYKQSNERLNESKDTKSARTFKKKCFDFFIFVLGMTYWGGREREREREPEEERGTLGYGLENVNLEIFLFILYSSMLLFLSQQIDFRETWVSGGSEFAS